MNTLWFKKVCNLFLMITNLSVLAGRLLTCTAPQRGACVVPRSDMFIFGIAVAASPFEKTGRGGV